MPGKHSFTIEETPAIQSQTSPVVTFFVPCYNEEGNVQATITTILQAMAKLFSTYEIIICDDGSVDRTKEIVRQFMKEHPGIPLRLVANRENKGLGFNYFRGAFIARGTYYMLINGDNVEPAEAIYAVVSHCGEADMIIPYFGLKDTRTGFRRNVSRVFTFLVNKLSGHSVRYYNGAVLHRTENVRFWRAETVGYGYQAEMVCRLLHEGMTYREVEVANSDRQWGFSKAFALANMFSVSNSLLHILWRRLEYTAFRLLKPGVTRTDQDRNTLL